MKKQEVIDEIEDAIPDFILNDFQRGKETGLTYALELVNQLDKPEKTVVPQFVADYIASEQRSYSTLSEAIDDMDDEKEVLCWFYDNPETFAKAWIYGCEVEKEKLYTVEIPNPNGFIRLVLCKDCDGKLFVATFSGGDCWETFGKCKLTEAEIKEDFEWAWQFAEEVKE